VPPQRYDLALFLELNAEYELKRVHRSPPPMDDAAERLKRKQKNVARIAKQLSPYLDLRGKTVLDFGCGMGDLDLALARDHDCTVTGVDIKEHRSWAELQHPRVQRLVVDLSHPGNADRFARQFDAIISISVLEHVKHPYRALEALRTVLVPRGVAWLKANLYRGPLASHRYREVYFPWPHLLFTDEVFREFYQSLGRKPARPSWVNKLTHLHYRDYFERIGFEVLSEKFSTRPIDEAFYARFEDVLGRYPRSDLERDFIDVVIRPR
jgi:SAM-dependent methyltransferase